MTLRQKTLPTIPNQIAMTELFPNLKLYTEREISEIKKRCKKNGRYQQYVDATGRAQLLRHTVFVINGNYYATQVGQSAANLKIKFAQDLQTGEWVEEQVLRNITEADFAAKLPQNSARLFRTTKPAAMEMPKYFGGNLDAYDAELEVVVSQPDVGKGYIFSKRVINNEIPINGLETAVNVGMLTINEFYRASEQGSTYLMQCIQDLKAYHFLYLVDAGDVTTDKELLAIKRKLEKSGVLVAAKVITESVNNLKYFLANNKFRTNKGHAYNIELVATPAPTVRADDVRFEISDSDDSDCESSEGLFSDNRDAAETYQVFECLSWFFRSLAHDICNPIVIRLNTRPSIFSRPASPAVAADESERQWSHLSKMV